MTLNLHVFVWKKSYLPYEVDPPHVSHTRPWEFRHAFIKGRGKSGYKWSFFDRLSRILILSLVIPILRSKNDHFYTILYGKRSILIKKHAEIPIKPLLWATSQYKTSVKVTISTPFWMEIPRYTMEKWPFLIQTHARSCPKVTFFPHMHDFQYFWFYMHEFQYFSYKSV